MPANPLRKLNELGQSVWLDNLSRPLVRGGGLARLISEDGLSGVTSNPTIFRKSMTGSTAYDDQFGQMAAAGRPVQEIYEALAVTDIQEAADVLRPVYDETGGRDGFVSLEVSPHLARDTKGTVDEAVRLWEAVARRNVLIKIPGTDEGVPAIQSCLAHGINVNVTLLFSLTAHRQVIEAYIRALESRQQKGESLDTVASVASFFLSRIDVKVDGRLEALAGGKHADEARSLMGRAAVANAKLAYGMWQDIHSSDRWKQLAEGGARVQPCLWASTSTKNPGYSDVMYVEPLVGPHTINTMPENTIEAFRDHGTAAVTIGDGMEESQAVMDRLAALGIDIDAVTADLVEEGIDKFVQPFDELMAALEAKRAGLVQARN